MMKKQDEIAEIIKERIRDGIYVPGVRLPAETIMADELGVNKITLNKAVAKLIADGLLIRGRSTRDGTFVREGSEVLPKGTITVMLRNLDSFRMRMISGITDAAARNNYLPVILNPSVETIELAVAKAKAGGTKGILSLAYNFADDGTFPIVFADCDLLPQKEKHFCVNCDSKNGGILLADKLLEAGHREIVYVANTTQIGLRENPRCSQFFERLAENGIKDSAARFYSIAHPENTFPRLLRKILQEHPKVTAIAAENDSLVMYLRKHAADMGQKFPPVTYVGFGDIQEYQRIDPFPTIDQGPYHIAEEAVETLVGLIEGRIPISKPFTKIIPVELKGAELIRQVK